MPALVSALVLTLAGPGPIAPPLSPTSDSDAIHAVIAAGDPAHTGTPAPLEQLLAATEIAEEKLRQATDTADADELLTLTAQGRTAAYGRTGEPLHLCRLIAAADLVLARKVITPGLSASARDFRQQAQGRLGASACEDTPPREQSGGPRAETDRGADTVKPKLEAPAPERPPQADRHDRRRVRAGVGTLVSGLALFAPMAGLLVYRAAGERDLTALDRETMDRPRTKEDDATAAALGQRYTATTAGAIVLGVTSAALVVTGAVLLGSGKRNRRMAAAPWGSWGAGGLVLEGKF